MNQVRNENNLKRYTSPLEKAVVLKKIIKGTELILENDESPTSKSANLFSSKRCLTSIKSTELRKVEQQEVKNSTMQKEPEDLFFLQPALPHTSFQSLSNPACSTQSIYFDSFNQTSLPYQTTSSKFYNQPSYFSEKSEEPNCNLNFINNSFLKQKQSVLLQPLHLQQLLGEETGFNTSLSSQIFTTPQISFVKLNQQSINKPVLIKPNHLSLNHSNHQFDLARPLNQSFLPMKRSQHMSSPTVLTPVEKQSAPLLESLKDPFENDVFPNKIFPKTINFSQRSLKAQSQSCSPQHWPDLHPSHSLSTYTSLPELTSEITSHSDVQPFLPQQPQKTRLTKKVVQPLQFNSRLRMNVSGQYFDIRLRVLERHPDTLLGNENARKMYYDKRRHEYFFDRHRPTFEIIFSYYLHGKRIKRPNFIPEDIFLEELKFFKIEKNIINEYRKQEGYSEDEDDEIVVESTGMKKVIWDLFEQPKSSRSALMIALTSVTMTVIAILLLCVETLPYFRKTSCSQSTIKEPFFILETICNIWFTLEVLIRFFTCPSKMTFLKDFKNIVDIASVAPFYFTLFTLVVTTKCLYASQNTSDALAFLRVIRLVRIFKLTKHSIGLQVMVLTFKESMEGLSIFLATLLVCMLFYSSALYYAEATYPNTQIHSIPDAFWWAIITMTTVGYGDKVPIGPLGRLIGSACAISGILTLAIPVPIIAGHFNKFYTHKTGRARYQRDG